MAETMTDTARKGAHPAKKLQSFDEDDIVRYSLGHDVPIVGMVRNRDDYKEMREISLIFGYTLGMARPRASEGAPADEPAEREAPTAAAAPKGPAKPAPVDTLAAHGETSPESTA